MVIDWRALYCAGRGEVAFCVTQSVEPRSGAKKIGQHSMLQDKLRVEATAAECFDSITKTFFLKGRRRFAFVQKHRDQAKNPLAIRTAY
jgi:hypothetical protein